MNSTLSNGTNGPTPVSIGSVKRPFEDSSDMAAGEMSHAKQIRGAAEEDVAQARALLALADSSNNNNNNKTEEKQAPEEAKATATTAARPGRECQPAPFFYYKDHSTVGDADPFQPLTAPGRVPNFPAKMHAILSRPDLADVVAWMPHGRAWRVLKPREFEIKVIPMFFEHSKFSSFVRQANGWGFRRITQGPDRNGYYHELFLRGLPHLSKNMKRPGVNEKKTADPDHEPDLYKISELHPVPSNAAAMDESILLECTVQGGPKARMPIYLGGSATSNTASVMTTFAAPTTTMMAPTAAPGHMIFPTATLAPKQQEMMMWKQPAVPTLAAARSSPNPTHPSAGAAMVSAPPSPSTGAPAAMTMPAAVGHAATAPVAAGPAAVNPMAFAAIDPSAAAQFAAGFAMATAFSQQHFMSMFQQMAQPQQQQPPQQQGL